MNVEHAPGPREWLDSSKSINSAIDDAIQMRRKDGVMIHSVEGICGSLPDGTTAHVETLFRMNED